MNTTTTATINGGMYGEARVHSVSITKDRVEIVRRASPHFTYLGLGSGQPPDRVWMEIWEVEGSNGLVRQPDRDGKHTPNQFTQEKIEFAQ